MGTKCAPTFANLLMESLEQEFLDSILEKVTPQPTLWIRFIDDIFVIWPDTRATFLDFFDALNSHHPNISYTHKLTTSSIAFLDLTIYKGHRFAESGILTLHPISSLPINSNTYTTNSVTHPAPSRASSWAKPSECLEPAATQSHLLNPLKQLKMPSQPDITPSN